MKSIIVKMLNRHDFTLICREKKQDIYMNHKGGKFHVTKYDDDTLDRFIAFIKYGEEFEEDFE